MPDPYAILGLDPAACSDDIVRAAYLDRIRRFPPEQAPEEFRLISEAYERLKTHNQRMHYHLFDNDPGAQSPCDCLRETASSDRRRPPAEKVFQEFLQQCLK